MRPPVHFEELRGVDVRVTLRRRQPHVPEQFLNRSQVRSSLQKMRGE